MCIKDIINIIKEFFKDNKSPSEKLNDNLLDILRHIISYTDNDGRGICIYCNLNNDIKRCDIKWQSIINNAFNERLLTKLEIKNTWINLYLTYEDELHSVLDYIQSKPLIKDNVDYEEVLQSYIYNLQKAIKFIDSL